MEGIKVTKLKHDVYDECPDINCMWHFGWNNETFAYIFSL